MKDLTVEELRLYDRQIRLWGLEAQGRISRSCVCLVGLQNHNSEIGKNLAAAGFNLVLCDDRQYSECNFTDLVIPPSRDEHTEQLTVAEVYMQRLRHMNSFIKIHTVKKADLKTELDKCLISVVSVAYGASERADVVESVKNRPANAPLLSAITYIGAQGTIIMLFCSPSGSESWRQSPSEILGSDVVQFHKKNKCAEALHEMRIHMSEGLIDYELPPFYGAVVGGVITQVIQRIVKGETNKMKYNCLYLSYDDGSMSVYKTGEASRSQHTTNKNDSHHLITAVADLDDD